MTWFGNRARLAGPLNPLPAFDVSTFPVLLKAVGEGVVDDAP